jgi:ankyrin repeat protein
MGHAIVAFLVIVVACACGPGPLPAPPASPDYRDPNYVRDSFRSDSDDPFPLDYAIRSGRLDEMRQLLQQGANPNLRWGQTGDHFPLQEVFDRGGYGVLNHVEAVKLLLSHGADPNARWCPFESRGRSEWRPSCTSTLGASALIFAAALGSSEIVELLLTAGADPTHRDWNNGSALDYAYGELMFEAISRAMFPDFRTRDQQALEWLRQSGRFSGLNAWESTPTSRAIALDRGPVLPPPPVHAFGPSYRAEQETLRMSRVRTLLRLGVDPNERTTLALSDWTPLAMALWQRAYRVAHLLLQNGADVNQRWCAPIRYWYDKISAPDPACNHQNGLTPLMWSASEGHAEAVELLLEFAADVSLKDWAGRSAADVARTDDLRRLIEGRSATAAPPPSR